MIQFRCWYCNKWYAVKQERIGERLVCSCRRRLRVPRRTGGNCRHRTLVDWIVELTVYGGGGALLGAALAFGLISKIPYRRGLISTWRVVLYGAALGLLLGAVFGEAGVNWVGRRLRRDE